MGLLKRIGYMVGVMGIISFCMPVLASENKEIQTEPIIEYEPIPQKDIEIVFIEPVEETALPDCPYTQEEIDLMARVVMSESSILPMDGKQAVAQTILNRVASEKYPDTISEVVYQVINGHKQYSTAWNGEPNADCYYAVEGAIEYPNAYPTDMFWFRTEYPHTFAHFYTQCGNTFFNTEIDYLNMEITNDNS